MSNYKIISFNETTGQLTIEYAVGMSPIAVDVPIVNGLYITGAELDSYIQGFIPFEYLDRQSKLNAGIANANEIKVLVQNPTPVELPSVLTPEQEQAIANQAMWEKVAFEKKVADALVKFGVLQENPVTIPVQGL